MGVVSMAKVDWRFTRPSYLRACHPLCCFVPESLPPTLLLVDFSLPFALEVIDQFRARLLRTLLEPTSGCTVRMETMYATKLTRSRSRIGANAGWGVPGIPNVIRL